MVDGMTRTPYLVFPSSEYWPGFGEHRRDIAGCYPLGAIGSRDGERYCHVAPFRQSDAGRAASRRPRQSNDCTVVALSHATGIVYDRCYDALKLAGRRSGARFDLKSWAKAETLDGWRLVWRAFPATKGASRVNPATFALKHREGRFILRVSKHVLACVDGIVLDSSHPDPHRCVYGAWEVVPASGVAS